MGVENFIFEELIECDNDSLGSLKETLNYLEKLFIRENQSLITELGYNVSLGGSDGKDRGKKIDVYDMNGNLINQFSSCSDAGNYYAVPASNISKLCNGKRSCYKQLVFRYSGEPFDKYPIRTLKSYNKRKVNQYSKTGEYIRTFDSIENATKNFTNKSSIAICNCCARKKSYNTAFGYKWFYADDVTQPDKSKIFIDVSGDYMNKGFIKTNNENTRNQLLNAGFTELTKEDDFFVFVNNSDLLKFCNINKDIVFTNVINI